MVRTKRRIQEQGMSLFINIPQKISRVFEMDKDKNIEELYCEAMIIKGEKAIVYFFVDKPKTEITEIK